MSRGMGSSARRFSSIMDCGPVSRGPHSYPGHAVGLQEMIGKLNAKTPSRRDGKETRTVKSGRLFVFPSLK